MFLMLTKAPLDEDSKNSNRVKYVLIKKNIYIYIYIYIKKKMYCDFKAEFSAAITPVRILRKSFWYADLKIKEH